MRLARLTVLVLASLAVTTSALANDPPRMKEIIFEDDHIAGEIMSPDQLRILEQQRSDLMTLVKPRASFEDRLLAAVENL